MTEKNNEKTSNPKQVQKVGEEQQPEKSKNLIFGGILLAMISIALLIFVLSEKLFHLN